MLFQKVRDSFNLLFFLFFIWHLHKGHFSLCQQNAESFPSCWPFRIIACKADGMYMHVCYSSILGTSGNHRKPILWTFLVTFNLLSVLWFLAVANGAKLKHVTYSSYIDSAWIRRIFVAWTFQILSLYFFLTFRQFRRDFAVPQGGRSAATLNATGHGGGGRSSAYGSEIIKWSLIRRNVYRNRPTITLDIRFSSIVIVGS